MAGENVTSTSSSISNPVSIDSPEVDWGLQLSQMLSSLGVSMLNWAQGVYSETAATVGPAIQKAMQSADFSYQQAQTLWQQYTSTYAPEMQQYAQEAGDYSSVAREQFNAGQAESATAQAEQQARQNALQTLTQEGINPSSGAYEEAELAAQTAAGAAEAGAGTQAAENTEAQGRQMLLNSIGVGEQLPGSTVNAINAGLSGLANAENASIGVGNLGVAASQAGVGYEQAAANANKVPPVGQVSRAGSQTQATPGNNGQSQGGQDKQGGGGGGQTTKTTSSPGGGNYGNRGSGQYQGKTTGQLPSTPPGTSGVGLGFGQGNGTNPSNPTQGAYDPYTGAYNPSDNGNPYAGGATVGGQPYAGDPFGQASPYDGGATVGGVPYPGDPFGQLNTTDTSTPGSGSGGGSGLGSFLSNVGNYISDSIVTPAQGEPNPSQFDPSNGGVGTGLPPSDPYNPGDTSQPDYNPYSQPDNGGGGYTPPPQQPDTGGYTPPDSGGGGYYAKGGPVHKHSAIPTTGGYASKGMSPSGGQQTDDINARLNAGEYVIPRDVTHDKGHEFFRNLIQKSRKNRMGLGAAQQKPIGAQMKPALPGPARFVSHAIPGGQ